MEIRIGSSAPRFSLPDEHERAVELPRVGIPTVLVFYRGDW
jgi:peroxiredoxin